jgi:hypothetical protein
MRKIEDITGQKYGRLIVLEFAGTHKRNALWKCRCECGNEKVIAGRNLKNGNVKSCGCLRSEKTISRNYKHGEINTHLYKIFNQMRNRCNNPNHKDFKDYGGRGIEVCQEWNDISAFLLFRDWAISQGYKDGLSIDRRENDKGYSPDNCRWVTVKEQNNNKRNNHLITYSGETKTLAQWATDRNIPRDILYSRIKLGWSLEDAFTKPIKGRDNQ